MAPGFGLAQAIDRSAIHTQAQAQTMAIMQDRLDDLNHNMRMSWMLNVPGGADIVAEIHYRRLRGESTDAVEEEFFRKLFEDIERRRAEMEAKSPEAGLTDKGSDDEDNNRDGDGNGAGAGTA